MQGIVVGTAPGREAWLKDCLESLKGSKYPVVWTEEYSYELGKIRWAYEHTNFDDILFIQDSCVIHDLKLLDMVFGYEGSVSITNHPTLFGCYLGKYRREVLTRSKIPVVLTKAESVRQETSWTVKYAALDSTINLFDDFDVPEKHFFEQRHGRNNLVLRNEYLTKYKGTWSPEQIGSDD